MKARVEVEQRFCDIPGCDRHGSFQCLVCDKDYCFRHGWVEKMVVEYKHGIRASGSGDGVYCRACDARLLAERTDALHAAYQVIAALRAEAEAFYENLTLRGDLAEAEVRRLWEASQSEKWQSTRRNE